ncbi:hypothetical protein TNCV_1833001 [Trichonephila clavipes]|nr:hypothetical protein TNCV_1833001 [Trichonephila clavipes]
MSDIGPFPGYFLDDKQYHSRARSNLRILRMPSPVQSNCDAHDTIAKVRCCLVNGTHTTGLRAYNPPSNVWQQFFGRSAFLRQQETDLPPAELWCACFC